jgi:putative transposase
MPRVAGIAPGDVIFHVLNRGNARSQIFEKDSDYKAFERILIETTQTTSVRNLADCIMPNHWHMVVWPTRDGELGKFVQRLTTTHVRRWHLYRHSVGNGHLYQGTYKSFPVQDDSHFLTVCRYVEQNPLRAKLVEKAEDWRWSSLGLQTAGITDSTRSVLSEWPVPRPGDWVSLVNQTPVGQELDALRLSAQKGRPFGNENWQTSIAARLGLESTLHPRGRPRKER